METESHSMNQNIAVYKEGSDTFFLVSSVSHGGGICVWMSIFSSLPQCLQEKYDSLKRGHTVFLEAEARLRGRGWGGEANNSRKGKTGVECACLTG